MWLLLDQSQPNLTFTEKGQILHVVPSGVRWYMVSFKPSVFQNFFSLGLFYIQPPACGQRGFRFTNKATKAQRTTGGPERFRNFFSFTQLMSGGEKTRLLSLSPTTGIFFRHIILQLILGAVKKLNCIPHLCVAFLQSVLKHIAFVNVRVNHSPVHDPTTPLVF